MEVVVERLVEVGAEELVEEAWKMVVRDVEEKRVEDLAIVVTEKHGEVRRE